MFAKRMMICKKSLRQLYIFLFICSYSTSQQTTPYGIPHFFLGGEESTDENISNSNNTPVDFDRDRLIGRGSFSVVCEGTFHHTKVAVKLFKDEVSKNKFIVTCF